MPLQPHHLSALSVTAEQPRMAPLKSLFHTAPPWPLESVISGEGKLKQMNCGSWKKDKNGSGMFFLRTGIAKVES